MHLSTLRGGNHTGSCFLCSMIFVFLLICRLTVKQAGQLCHIESGICLHKHQSTSPSAASASAAVTRFLVRSRTLGIKCCCLYFHSQLSGPLSPDSSPFFHSIGKRTERMSFRFSFSSSVSFRGNCRCSSVVVYEKYTYCMLF